MSRGAWISIFIRDFDSARREMLKMNVFECVTTLSSVRSFTDKDASPEAVRRVMESGRMAPSAHNNQPWEFVLVEDPEKLGVLGRYCTSGSFVARAAFAVVVVTDPRSKWHEIDGTRAAQNMVITAWSLGLGSCWIGRIEEEELKRYLDVPSELNILTVLPFGHFSEDRVPSSKFRKSPAEVFHRDGYGKGYEE